MDSELIENVDFYYDKDGFVVLTQHYHETRGYCCGYGCRHCPYQYESVPEPKRSTMLSQQQQQQ